MMPNMDKHRSEKEIKEVKQKNNWMAISNAPEVKNTHIQI